ncbi:hypothetical protein [Streptomyces parvulus]|uniref:hypothetical protein n=1 Tax=Streptomyces parvulus TaxID=146923 RepID=UPI0036C239A5
MAVQQLPGAVGDFTRHLAGLLTRLDQGGGWCGVFWRRDPDGMRACLDGREIPPWDVVEALLQDFAERYGAAAAGAEAGPARALYAAALTVHDARPGARDALVDRLDVMLRERRYAGERAARLTRTLSLPDTTPEAAGLLHLDLAWAHDDHTRATARCTELRARLTALDAVRRGSGGDPADDGPTAPAPGAAPGAPADDPAGRWGRPEGSTSGFDGWAGGGEASGAAVDPAGPVHPPAHGRVPGVGAGGTASAPGGWGEAAPGQGSVNEAGPAGSGLTFGASSAPDSAPAFVAPGASGTSAPTGLARAPGDGRIPGRETNAPVGHAPADPPAGYPLADRPAPPPAGHPAPPPAVTPWGPKPVDHPGAGHPPVGRPAPLPAGHHAPPPGGRPPRSPAPAEHPASPPAATSPGADPADHSAPPSPGPEPAPTPTRTPAPKQRRRRRGSARFAGAVDVDLSEVAAGPVPVPEGPGPRGARFAGGAGPGEEDDAPVPGEDDLGAVDALVEELARLRAAGLSGAAHALLAEAALGPAQRFPLLAARLERAGLGADWTTLLWETAALPPDALAAVADALARAGRRADAEQVLRQDVVRPAAETGAAVLGLAAEGRHREARALLDACVRSRTPQDAARSAAPDPEALVPLLLDTARGVSARCHRDLVHALRVAGFTA